MMVLQNLDYILIKAGYDDNQDTVRSVCLSVHLSHSLGGSTVWDLMLVSQNMDYSRGKKLKNPRTKQHNSSDCSVQSVYLQC